jgi:hypothetical protein
MIKRFTKWFILFFFPGSSISQIAVITQTVQIPVLQDSATIAESDDSSKVILSVLMKPMVKLLGMSLLPQIFIVQKIVVKIL